MCNLESIKRTIVVGSIMLSVCSLFGNLSYGKEDRITLPYFLVSGEGEKLGYKDWLCLTHIGPQDKLMEDFVIAFTIKENPVGIDHARYKLLLFSEKEKKTIFDFLQISKNTKESPDYGKLGTYQLIYCSNNVIREVWFMDSKQTLSFCQLMDGFLKEYKSGDTVTENIFKSTVKFLSKVASMEK